MRKLNFGLLFFVITTQTFAQLPYTQNQYSVRVENDIEYGTATNYAGMPDTLKLDLYKPVNDNNCHRPLLVIIHGGSWIAGTKKDYEIVSVAQQMAAKGYAVASINYRLGTHKAASWTQWVLCSTSLVTPCVYISDSSEVYRAIFRGMQDAKGAIRFLKNRSAQDSTDANNVFVAGASAGGFIAMATAFLDLEKEKPANCFSINNAPVPESALSSCNPKNPSFLRPDLGSVEGTLNTGSADAKIKGVGCFYGGLPSLRWVEGADTPAIYLFHQQSDVIVSSGYAPLLGRINYECINGLCQPTYFYPRMYGCGAISDSLNAMGISPSLYQADIVKNWNGNANCLQNPPGHSIDNIVLRSQHLADVFAPVIAESGNIPSGNCFTAVTEPGDNFPVNIFPNPVSGTSIFVSVPVRGKSLTRVAVYDLFGRKILEEKVAGDKVVKTVRLPDFLPRGVYFLVAETVDNRVSRTRFIYVK